MKRTKKPPRSANFGAAASRASAEEQGLCLLYQTLGKMQAPIWTGKEASFRVRMGTRVAYDRDRLGNRPAVPPDRLD